MLERDDPAWRTLGHAYGVAEDIPSLLDALDACHPLPARWQDEPLASLWQALCHQTSIFDASYAAVPHLIEIAARRPAVERAWVLHLVGSIVAYAPLGAALPEALRQAYESARARGAELVRATLAATRPERLRDGLLLMADLAACRGHARLARAIMAMESGEVEVQCACGLRETLGVADSGIVIEPLGWRRRPAPGAKTPATAGLATLAGSLGLAACERVLAELGGGIECEGCGEELDLLAGIAAVGP